MCGLILDELFKSPQRGVFKVPCFCMFHGRGFIVSVVQNHFIEKVWYLVYIARN